MGKVFIIMGVSGCGKTTVGESLAGMTGGEFFDGDKYHSAANVEKMRSGSPLSDADRQTWLESLRDLIAERAQFSSPSFIACSALKKSYRDILRSGRDQPTFIFLEGQEDLIRQRLDARVGHYMPAGLLSSQFAALERPKNAITVDISGNNEEIVREILSRLELDRESPGP